MRFIYFTENIRLNMYIKFVKLSQSIPVIWISVLKTYWEKTKHSRPYVYMNFSLIKIQMIFLIPCYFVFLPHVSSFYDKIQIKLLFSKHKMTEYEQNHSIIVLISVWYFYEPNVSLAASFDNYLLQIFKTKISYVKVYT